jgi:flagellar hook-associated protein 1 FlgK
VLLQKAATLADKLRLTDERLGALRADLDDSLRESVSRANDLLAGIAHLNRQIADLESRSAGAANDLRDTRQEKLEALAKLVKLDVSTRPDGSLGIAIAGTEMVNGGELAGSLTAQDDGSGRVKVRGADGTPLNLTGGSMQGVIDARDDTVAALRDRLDRLAGALIREVNAAHAGGFSLEQTTGALFFAGTGAASIAVNPELLENPARVQASGAAEAVGDNQVALRLAQLADQKLPALNDQTLIQAYGQTVASLGQSLAGANAQVGDQGVIEAMLQRQRDSTGGVSLDEEMTQMVKFQKAFQASARLIATLDEMLDTVMSMKR